MSIKKLETALFSFLQEHSRIPTKAELIELAKVDLLDFERIAAKNEVFNLIWNLTNEEKSLLLEKLESDENDSLHTLSWLMYLIAEVHFILVNKALDSKK